MTTWYAGADHAGYLLKDELVQALRECGDEIFDLGTKSAESVDYPDYGCRVARQVVSNAGAFGLLVCGTGIGMAMTANKIAGIRAAVVTNTFTAQATRAHNHANIICLGSRVIGAGVARAALLVFRESAFTGGRHQRRIDKIARAAKEPLG